MQYETVIGLETHVELATESKIFCACSTKFGGEPNTHCCPVCTGMPGTLPVVNRKVVEYAIRAGLAVGCDITRLTKFDRKNYFYPDLPKAYQISQLHLSLCRNGMLEVGKDDQKHKIRIKEIHMEEDAGKLIHDPWEDCTLIDYNRCGVPLIEIVTEPDLRSSEDAVEYLEKLKLMLQYLGVSDCKMQEGSLRTDLNISVRPAGSKEYGTRTEMKNMNSFKAIARAIEVESKRQIEVLEDGGKVIQDTRRWDDNKDASFTMRTKENAQDYRYFPDPDLTPIEIDDDWIRSLQASQPELPEQKKARYLRDFALSQYDIDIICSTKAFTSLYDGTVQLGAPPKEVANWILGDLSRLLNDTGKEPEEAAVTPQALADLIALIEKGRINRNVSKKIFEVMVLDGADPTRYMKENGLEMVGDENAIGTVIDAVLEKNVQAVAEYRSGKEKTFGFIVGQVMRELKGKADPAAVNKLLKEKLS